MKARLITPDGKDTIIEPENGKNFSLKELYELIGTDIVQVLPLPISGKLMIMDEEGKMKPNYIINKLASDLSKGHTVVGTVVVCEMSMFK